MFHVCIFTDSTNEKFVITGGSSEKEVMQNLSKIVSEKYAKRNFVKLIVFKSFLMISEGETYLAAIKNLDNRDIARLIVSENPLKSDLSRHLLNQ